jgi:hypothetical protein
LELTFIRQRDQLVEHGQKRRKRFPRTGRRSDQAALAFVDEGNGAALRRAERVKCPLEPPAHQGVKYPVNFTVRKKTRLLGDHVP